MNEGMSEATQVVRVTMEGTEMFIKASYMTIKEIASLIIAYKSYKETTLAGEIKLKKLLKLSDGDVRLLKIPEERKEEVARALKKYQIKYSLMPDLNLMDGKCEFGFALSDLPRVNSLIESLKLGEVISNADYIKNADAKVLDKLANNLLEDEKLNEKKELATEMVADKRFITVSKELIHEETETAFKTRIPGTKGKKYLWLEKDKIKDIHDEKTILTYLENDKNYKVYSADGVEEETIKGKELGEKYYDNVNMNVVRQYGSELLEEVSALEKAKQFDEQVKANKQIIDISKVKITLPENCVVERTDTQIKIKLPKKICRHNYKETAYIWVPDRNILADKEQKKIILTTDFGTKHMVCNKNDKVIDTMGSSRLKNVFEAEAARNMKSSHPQIVKKVMGKVMKR